MSKLGVFILAASSAIGAFADSPYEEQIGSILQDVASEHREVRQGATNRIDALMGAISNCEQIATCKLLKAKLRMECAEITGADSCYDPGALADATNLCRSALRDISDDRSKWQFYGASLLLPLPLSMDGKFDDMFSVATNALASTSSLAAVSFETNAWHALFGCPVLTPDDGQTAFRTLAASSLLLSDRNADISVYTNGLSQAGLDALAGLLAH